MSAEHEMAVLEASFDQMRNPQDRVANETGRLIPQPLANFSLEFDSQAMRLAVAGTDVLTVGLIDCYVFSRECLMKAIECVNPRLIMLPFASVEDCVGNDMNSVDLIVYYPHAEDASESTAARDVLTIRQAFPDIPLMLLSDAEEAEQPRTLRSALKSGAHGFIPTRTTGITVTAAAIRFVKAGGTFAPLDLLMTARQDTPGLSESARKNSLTSRQMAVMSHLQQGNANKIIAHELSMRESTVKIHIHNILRKVGATNRTQAAFKARQLHKQQSSS
jgi:DNA-binding NarL/FixJ family response regulator